MPLPLLGAIGAVILVGIILVVVALGSGGDSGGPSVRATANTGPDHDFAGILPTSGPAVEATIDLNRPTAVSPNLTSVAEGDRLIIAKYNVSAPLTYRTVGLDGVMPNPAGPDDVAYYDFSAWPGLGGAPGRGGNAVFAGHVDSGAKACKNGTVAPPCQAVFWDIGGLRVGDQIQVQLSGTTTTYRVTSNQPISATAGPWNQIVSSTAQESITLITCGGDFNRETREYTNRQVVTAVRIT